MAWVAVQPSGIEMIYEFEPHKIKKEITRYDPTSLEQDYHGHFVGYVGTGKFTYNYSYANGIRLPKGSIKKLIGRDLDWNDEPVELKEE